MRVCAARNGSRNHLSRGFVKCSQVPDRFPTDREPSEQALCKSVPKAPEPVPEVPPPRGGNRNRNFLGTQPTEGGGMTTTASSVQSCRSTLPRPVSPTKTGKPRKTNQYPTVCYGCGDRLAPGEAMVGGMDGGRIKWLCGSARWDRP